MNHPLLRSVSQGKSTRLASREAEIITEGDPRPRMHS